jgi:hypothetical protein
MKNARFPESLEKTAAAGCNVLKKWDTLEIRHWVDFRFLTPDYG